MIDCVVVADSPVRRSFNAHPRESFNHVPGEAGKIESKWAMFGASIVEAADRCRGTPGAADRYQQAKQCAAVAVAEAKTWAWEAFSEAMENTLRDLQLWQDWFAADWEAAGMRISTLKSKAMDLSRKHVRSAFSKLGRRSLFTSEG